jgi:hypothetical protein
MKEIVLSAVRHLCSEGLHLADAGMRLDVLDSKSLPEAFCYKSSFESVDLAL